MIATIILPESEHESGRDELRKINSARANKRQTPANILRSGR